MPTLRNVAWPALALTGGMSLICLVGDLLRQASIPPVHAQDRPRQLTNSIGMKFTLIPKGMFEMGSAETELDRNSDEPRHSVVISKDFYLGVYEVTQKQFEAVMGTNPSFFTPVGPGKAKVKSKSTSHHPVEQVTWYDAVAFCKKLGELPDEKEAKHSYRLPTEAEWEYACRAGTTTGLHYGDKVNAYKANFNGLSPYGDGGAGPFLRATAQVGEYSANAFGLHDMHGNVAEWCADWYAADYYYNSAKIDPIGPETGTERVLRGGAWVNTGKACRSAARFKLAPDLSSYSTGLRVVLVKP
jgi:formylglycine-generating enzyme required for sulfatase activity